MSTPATENKATRSTQPKNGGAPAGDPSAKPAQGASERFKKLGEDRYMFNPNKGCSGSLVGFLLALIPMPPIERGKEMKDWDCFVIRTTEPCKALDREGQVIDVEPGRDVLTPATFKLAEVFSRAAMHPKACFEVYIRPTKKIDIGSGQTMWLYELGADPRSFRLRTDIGIAAMLPNPAIPQLAQGSATAESDSELPF